MNDLFQDRQAAGQLLARQLAHLKSMSNLLILALPRGGVPVAFEVAKSLKAPLDVFLVRKLGLPGHEELAMGAIATGNVRVLNEEVVREFAIHDDLIEAVAEREGEELARREKVYRGNRPPPKVDGRIVILIDDGVATGSTMRAAIAAVRAQKPARIVVAVPTIAPSTLVELKAVADEVVAVMTPACFYAVGQWYRDFSQTTDEEVCRLLQQAAKTRAAGGNKSRRPPV